MQTFCETFNCWLFHHIDTVLICLRRVKFFADCRKCKGVESPKTVSVKKEETIPKLIALSVNRGAWADIVRGIQEEYSIAEGTKQDPLSARRIAILLGEAYVTNFKDQANVVLYVPIVEKDAYDKAMEYRLRCDPLEREAKVKPAVRRQILVTWGVDKVSGMEGYTTQLKEWAATALLGAREEEKDGKFSSTGDVDGRGTTQDDGVEADRTQIFEGRKRDALRPIEQDAASLP